MFIEMESGVDLIRKVTVNLLHIESFEEMWMPTQSDLADAEDHYWVKIRTKSGNDISVNRKYYDVIKKFFLQKDNYWNL